VRFLFDTHVLLWAAAAPDRLPQELADLIRDPANVRHFSVASIWEVAIKAQLGRPDFQHDASVLRLGLLQNAYAELPITGRHALAAGALPPVHRDPFDRMLVAQAAAEDLILVTMDAAIAAYPGPIRLVRR
jgi:PIN domain nuclease of toxin-antitoxin system